MTTYLVSFPGDKPGSGEFYRNTTERDVERELRRTVPDSLEPGESIRVDVYEYSEEWERVDDLVMTLTIQSPEVEEMERDRMLKSDHDADAYDRRYDR